MVSPAEGIAAALVDAYGRSGFLRRVSDPLWFQSLACVLRCDWHFFDTATVTTASPRDALDRVERGLREAATLPELGPQGTIRDPPGSGRAFGTRPRGT